MSHHLNLWQVDTDRVVEKSQRRVIGCSSKCYVLLVFFFSINLLQFKNVLNFFSMWVFSVDWYLGFLFGCAYIGTLPSQMSPLSFCYRGKENSGLFIILWTNEIVLGCSKQRCTDGVPTPAITCRKWMGKRIWTKRGLITTVYIQWVRQHYKQ